MVYYIHRDNYFQEVDMKGSEIIIQILNEQLADELTAVNQYMVHAGMCANWGYEKLHNTIEKRALSIGAKVDLQLKNDLQAELGAAATYNAGIKKAVEVGDNGTRELFESTLKDEERHIDWLEAQLDQIEQMGLANYLVEQLG
jgi:bacterioferritin